MKRYSRLLIGVSCIAAAMTAPALAQEAPEEGEDSAASSEIVVTGSRGKGRTVISSPTPIDVIGGEWLTEINVTSPTGIVAIDRFNNSDTAGMIWDAIVRRIG